MKCVRLQSTERTQFFRKFVSNILSLYPVEDIQYVTTTRDTIDVYVPIYRVNSIVNMALAYNIMLIGEYSV